MSKKPSPSYLPLFLTLAILSLFGPALLDPSLILFPTFSQFSDLMVIHWPKAQLMAQNWQAGNGLPYWTPLILSGMPLAANQLAMLFYPPAWLFLILPSEPVFNMLFIFHLLLGGAGIYFLLREGYGLSAGAALLGGLTFALNGKWLAHAAGGHVSMVGAIGWLPWVVLGMQMLLKETSHPQQTNKNQQLNSKTSPPAPPLPRSPAPLLPHASALKWAILVAIALALQITTHTLIVLYSVYLIAAMVAWQVIRNIGWQRRASEWSTIARSHIPLLTALSIIPILAGLLGAVQWLSLLELVQFSNRSLDLEQAANYAVTPAQLTIGLLLPSSQAGHEHIIYLGLVPLLLAPFGLSRRNCWSWFYALLFVFTILFALGPYTPVHALFYNFAPGFGWVRTPARMFFIGALAIAALTGFGVERLQQARWPASLSRWLTRLTIALAGFALLIGLGLAFGFDQLGRATLALAIFVPIGLILILLRIKRILPARTAIILLGCLLYLDLASFDLSLMRFVSLEEALAPGRPVAEYLAQKPGYFRVYSPSYSLPMQTAAATNLTLADGVEPVHLANYDQYMARAGGYQDASFSVTIPNFGDAPPDSALQDTRPNLSLLGLLNVKYLASAFPMDWPRLVLEQKIDDTYIYQNEHALPRAWIAYQTIPTEMDWLGQLETISVADVVTLAASGPILDSPGQDDVLEPPDEANISHYSANRLDIETEAIQEPGGWLVVSEIWYPGWQATLNGQPQPVERVNGFLRGLYLEPPGPYQIRLEYRPRAIVWGGWVSGLTTGLMGLITVWFLFRSSRQQ